MHRNLSQEGRDTCMRKRERIKVGHWDKDTSPKVGDQWDRLKLRFLFFIVDFTDMLDKCLSAITHMWHRRMDYAAFQGFLTAL